MHLMVLWLNPTTQTHPRDLTSAPDPRIIMNARGANALDGAVRKNWSIPLPHEHADPSPAPACHMRSASSQHECR